MENELKKLIELQAAATGEAWKVRRNQSTNKPACQVTTPDKEVICSMARGDLGFDDAQFMVAARNFDLAALDEKIKRYEDALQYIAHDPIELSHDKVELQRNEYKERASKAIEQ